ncbi:hypothetical protein HJG60_010278 [Phyllostomus discolor]|uniref:Uncharacterized protein n=1 Tax=Phyllostomus discolor TaxID=89673 RepID=A0A834AWN8_9CHIR|nr:hypothetical protein HJG60_010278 [Phyllostomus discolor]
MSAPPTGLGECFFFNSLVVRLPYSSFFWQFWLGFFGLFLNLLSSFFWLCKEAPCVYLHLHLGQKLHLAIFLFLLLTLLLSRISPTLPPPPSLCPCLPSLHCCLCPWVMHICSLANPFTFFHPEALSSILKYNFLKSLLIMLLHNEVCKISIGKYVKFIFSTIFSTSPKMISKVNRLFLLYKGNSCEENNANLNFRLGQVPV